MGVGMGVHGGGYFRHIGGAPIMGDFSAVPEDHNNRGGGGRSTSCREPGGFLGPGDLGGDRSGHGMDRGDSKRTGARGFGCRGPPAEGRRCLDSEPRQQRTSR